MKEVITIRCRTPVGSEVLTTGTLSSNEQFVSQPLNHCSNLKFYPVESLGRKNVVEAALTLGILVILTHALRVIQ